MNFAPTFLAQTNVVLYVFIPHPATNSMLNYTFITYVIVVFIVSEKFSTFFYSPSYS